MGKNRITDVEKKEFKETSYGKKCYNTFILYVVLLFASCIVTGFLIGYQEVGKEAFKYQNIVMLLSIIVAIISAVHLGKIEGALNVFVIMKSDLSKKKDDNKKNDSKKINNNKSNSRKNKDKNEKNS